MRMAVRGQLAHRWRTAALYGMATASLIQPGHAGYAADTSRAGNLPMRSTPRFQLLVAAMLLAVPLTPALAADTAPLEQRCGWFENPTPGNATLTDREGEWEIGVQGGHQADGDWPEFTDAQWVETNGHHGYGCACLSVRSDRQTHTVLSIARATAKPLTVCRGDKRLREPVHELDDEN